MANYDAQINILVSGQRNVNNLVSQLNQVEDAITQIESKWRTASAALQRADIRLGVTGRQQPRGEGGRLARDPDRQARFNAFAARRSAARDLSIARGALRIEAQREAIVRDQIDGNERLLRQAERRITFEQRLNSAVQLFETRRQKFVRGGGGSETGLRTGLQAQARALREEANSIQAAYDAAGGGASRNLRLVNALATGLGRVVEGQNELNRLQALGSKGFESGRRLQERISVVAERGVIPSGRIDKLRSRVGEAIAASNSGNEQAYSEALRAAKAAISRVERESKKLADDIAKNAPRSPILGGVNFPGSPKAEAEAVKRRGDALKENEKLSSAAVALEKQRQSALEKIFQVEEKIRSSKRISFKDAQDYYFQAQLPRLALPFGDVNQPAMRGGARQAGPSMIQGRAEPRIREVLGGARTADEAAATLRLAQATQKLSQATKTIDPQYNRFLPDEKMLNASGRGIQRLTTSQEEFNQAVVSGTRFQQKFNQEQERLRKIYGTPAPVGMGAPVSGAPGGKGGRPTPFLEGIGIGQRGSAAISEGLIGGAFPLLFGQGIGASAGGLIGGAAGGFAGGGLGFGLSLIGTALGSAFDTFNTNLKELAKSLKDPTASLEAMKTAGLRVTPELEYLVQKLDSSGRAVEAQRAVFAELERQLGAGGVQQLQALNAEQKELDRQWQELSATLTTLLLPAITGTIAIVNDVINGFKGLGSVKLPPWLQKSIEAGVDFQNTVVSVANPGLGISRLFAQNVINRGRQEAAKQAGAGAEDLTLQKQEQALEGQRQVADQIKSAYREGFQLQQRAIDLEIKTADIRRRIENEIFNKQQGLLQQQIDNDRKRAQIAIEAVDLEYQKRIANEEGRAAEVLAAEAEFFRTRAQGEAEIATAKKLLDLDIAKRQRETQDYVYSLGREADSIRRETLNLEMEVADYRLKIEREIENERLIAAAAKKTKGGVAASAVPDLNAGMTGANWPAGVPRPGTPTGNAVTRSGRPIWSGAPAGVIEYYTGDPAMRGTPAYDPRGHGGAEHHEHVAFKDAESKDIAIKALRGVGLMIGSQYRPGDPGFHGKNLAIDVPAYPNFARMGFPDNAQGEQMLGALVRRTIAGALGGATAAASTSTAAQLQQAGSQIRRPSITPVPVGMAAGAMAALNAQDTKIKKEAITLDQKLAQLQEEKARQRLYEIARGPIELKQRREAVGLATAELAAIGPMSQNRQEMVLFEAQAAEKVKIRMEEDRKILAGTKLQGTAREELARALEDGLEITKQQIELDKQALGIAQQRRFLEERSALQQQISVTGAAQQAGFFGAGASAYTAELLKSGNAGQAAELAQLTRAQEVSQTVASVRDELNSLTDPMNQVIGAASAIGGAFSESFKGVISGSMTAKEALANFFQSTADYFLDMATQIIQKWIVMTILNQALKLFPGGGGPGLSDLNAPATINNPLGDLGNIGGAYAKGGMFGSSITPFAMGGAFTNSIVSSPTLFKFANGGVMNTGVMGEAGPEAIMPLSRGPGGRLGVDASGAGGGDISVTVNVDAKGTGVEGNQQQGAALGRVISAAVQAEIIKQQRPGGLLTR